MLAACAFVRPRHTCVITCTVVGTSSCRCRVMRSYSDSPSSSSSTRNGCPLGSLPESYTSQMYGLRIAAAARASRRKRSTTIDEPVSSCASTLMAMRLPMSMFSASWTVAMPPRPISRVMRYFPARTVPTGIFVLLDTAIG